MVRVRPLGEPDLDAARQIYQDSFCAFLRVPPELLGDADLVGARFRSEPGCALAAEIDSTLVGINFVSVRGSLAVPGPVNVRPRGWTGNAGTQLMEEGLSIARARGVTQCFGFTHSRSPKHIEFYQRFGFRPRSLTVIAQTAVRPPPGATEPERFSARPGDRADLLAQMRSLTDRVWPGLDCGGLVTACADHGLGETVLLTEGSRLAGFAVCHLGRDSEAGSQNLYVKFGVVDPEGSGEARVDRLLGAIHRLGAAHGAIRLTAPVNTMRRELYGQLLARGFHPTEVGVAMVYPPREAHLRPGVLVFDDGR